jgi:hypothetical protein
VVEIVAVEQALADEKVDEETVARSTNAHTAKRKIIPPKHAEYERTQKTTHTPGIQPPSGMTNKLGTTAVSHDTSSPTASTSNVPGINATKSTKAHHLHRLLQ